MSGQILAYAGGPATLQLSAEYPEASAQGLRPAAPPTPPGRLVVYASGVVDAGGHFSLSLPSSAETQETIATGLQRYTSLGFVDPVTGVEQDCRGLVTASDPTVAFADPSLSLGTDGRTVYEGAFPPDPTLQNRRFKTIRYWYVGAPVTVIGGCPGAYTFDVHLQAGWNAVTQDGSTPGAPTRFETVPGQQFPFHLL